MTEEFQEEELAEGTAIGSQPSEGPRRSPLVDRPVLPTLVRLAWPIVVGHLLHLTYQLVDTFWVGRLGAEPLAAVSVSFPIIFIVFSLAAGFSIAGVALVSQHSGAAQREEASLAAGQVIGFSLALAFTLAALGLAFGRPLLMWVGAGPEVLPLAWTYFSILTGGIPLIFVFFVFAAVLEGTGDTITPMKLKIASVLLNIVLDPLLIFGWFLFPEMGIAGAAVATVVSRLASATVGVYILVSGRRGLTVRPRHLVPRPSLIKQVVRIGTPAALGTSAVAVAMTVMTSIVAAFGTYALAAWGVGNRVLSLIRMPSMGFARATGVLVGQHLGADQPRAASRSAWTGVAVNVGIMALVVLAFQFGAGLIMRLFSQDIEVIEIGAQYLRWGAAAYGLLAIQQVLGGALDGAGQTMQKMLFLLLSMWALQIPLSVVFSANLGLGVNGVWYAVFVAKLVGASAIALWFLRGTWQRKVIAHQAG
ncbi:MAG: MATE family efflux transporter [Candidatus Bipolaricaulota bacterium]